MSLNVVWISPKRIQSSREFIWMSSVSPECLIYRRWQRRTRKAFSRTSIFVCSPTLHSGFPFDENFTKFLFRPGGNEWHVFCFCFRFKQRLHTNINYFRRTFSATWQSDPAPGRSCPPFCLCWGRQDVYVPSANPCARRRNRVSSCAGRRPYRWIYGGRGDLAPIHKCGSERPSFERTSAAIAAAILLCSICAPTSGAPRLWCRPLRSSLPPALKMKISQLCIIFLDSEIARTFSQDIDFESLSGYWLYDHGLNQVTLNYDHTTMLGKLKCFLKTRPFRVFFLNSFQHTNLLSTSIWFAT